MGQKRTGYCGAIGSKGKCRFFFTIARNVRVSQTKIYWDLTTLNFGTHFHGCPYFGRRFDYYYRGAIFWATLTRPVWRVLFILSLLALLLLLVAYRSTGI